MSKFGTASVKGGIRRISCCVRGIDALVHVVDSDRCAAKANSPAVGNLRRQLEAFSPNRRFQFVRLAGGGIAPVPLRFIACETALQGRAADAAVIAKAAKQATSGAKPLPMTAYKLDERLAAQQSLIAS